MEIIGFLFAVAIIAGMVIYGAFSWGYVLMKFWHWFLIPVFPTLQPIFYFQAIGLYMCIALIKSSHAKKPLKKELYDEDQSLTVKILNFLSPWILLTMGFFIHQLIR